MQISRCPWDSRFDIAKSNRPPALYFVIAITEHPKDNYPNLIHHTSNRVLKQPVSAGKGDIRVLENFPMVREHSATTCRKNETYIVIMSRGVISRVTSVMLRGNVATNYLWTSRGAAYGVRLTGRKHSGNVESDSVDRQLGSRRPEKGVGPIGRGSESD